MPLRQQKRYQPKHACLIDHNALGNKPPRGVRNKSAPRWWWYLPLLWVALSAGYPGTLALASEEVVQIRIMHRDANDMLTIVQPLISQYGFKPHYLICFGTVHRMPEIPILLQT